jgi:hypothetical protein
MCQNITIWNEKNAFSCTVKIHLKKSSHTISLSLFDPKFSNMSKSTDQELEVIYSGY